MTPAQRRAVSRQNAQKSTGPKTPEGKERASRNSLKHGCCAEHFALIIEKPEDIQHDFDEWFDHYDPVGPAESALVKDIAVSHLNLNRCKSREAAVVDLQVRAAYHDWNNQQEDQLVALRQLLATDPARAARELKRFGAGRRWMIDRWKSFARWLERDGYCRVTALVEEGVRLLGGNHPHYKNGPLVAFMFRLSCSGAQPNANPDHIAWLLSETVIHPDYDAEYGRSHPTREGCRDELRRIVAREIEALEEFDKNWRDDERAAGVNACCRAQLPAEGPETRLALRYESMHRAAIHKAMKELDRLQKERCAAETELDDPPAPVPDVLRNEPDTPPASPPSAETVATCDASEDTNPEVPSPGTLPPTGWACPDPADMPAQTCACHPPEGVDSPPA